jgi:hypothetical protein
VCTNSMRRVLKAGLLACAAGLFAAGQGRAQAPVATPAPVPTVPTYAPPPQTMTSTSLRPHLFNRHAAGGGQAPGRFRTRLQSRRNPGGN